MNIVRCPRCMNLLHSNTKCYHCGNEHDFKTVISPDVHEYACDALGKMESLIVSKNFKKALECSCSVVEWMPTFPGVYWLRTLANYRCSNAIELIHKGFPCNVSPDFQNALRFSVEEEKQIYTDINHIMENVQYNLIKSVSLHENYEKTRTGVLSLQQEIPFELKRKLNRLHELWFELEQIEQSMRLIELKFQNSGQEYFLTLQHANMTMKKLLDAVNQTHECNDKKFHALAIQIGMALQQSEESAEILHHMRLNHPWTLDFRELIRQRNDCLNRMTQEFVALSRYKNQIQGVISSIQEIEAHHKKILIALKRFHFEQARALLGTQEYEDTFHNAGVI